MSKYPSVQAGYGLLNLVKCFFNWHWGYVEQLKQDYDKKLRFAYLGKIQNDLKI